MKPEKQKTGFQKGIPWSENTKISKIQKGQDPWGKKSSIKRGSSASLFQKNTKLSSERTKLEKGSTELKVSAKAGSTRLIGDLEEAQVIHTFEKANLLVEETQNSGATNFDGDLVVKCIDPDYIRAEVKFRNVSGFTIQKNHWHDIKRKSLKFGGTPALITVNKDREKLITMDLNDLALILKEAIGLCKTT